MMTSSFFCRRGATASEQLTNQREDLQEIGHLQSVNSPFLPEPCWLSQVPAFEETTTTRYTNKRSYDTQIYWDP